MRFIDDFDVILLDQGKTFMFDNDRFGPDADYFSTYRRLSGLKMSPDQLRAIVEELCARLLAICRDPSRFESFPSVADCLRELQFPFPLDEEEIARIADLIALHEIGEISDRDAAAIRAMSRTHRLGIVSNIWAEKDRFEEKLRETGIYDCFEHRVWSSDLAWIKPSRKLFELALSRFNVPSSRVIFVGDHPVRDIDAAGAMGFSTVWIRHGDAKFPEKLRSPDRTIRHLEELLQI